MWLVGDLSELDLAAAGYPDLFDAIVVAGNVMTFWLRTASRLFSADWRRT